MTTDRLLEQVKTRLQSVYGDRLRSIILYGSQARDDAESESDIDILVVLAGPVARLREHRTIMNAIYPLILEIERPIHAKPVDVSAYEEAAYPLYQNAKREGVVV